jgi:hypothetical protein
VKTAALKQQEGRATEHEAMKALATKIGDDPKGWKALAALSDAWQKVREAVGQSQAKQCGGAPRGLRLKEIGRNVVGSPPTIFL